MTRYFMMFDIIRDSNNHLHVYFNDQISNNFSLEAKFSSFLGSTYVVESELSASKIGDGIIKIFNEKQKEERRDNGNNGELKLYITEINESNCFCHNLLCVSEDVPKYVVQLAGKCQKKD